MDELATETPSRWFQSLGDAFFPPSARLRFGSKRIARYDRRASFLSRLELSLSTSFISLTDILVLTVLMRFSGSKTGVCEPNLKTTTSFMLLLEVPAIYKAAPDVADRDCYRAIQ
jgi:hypothetical protein